jgi:hypothetical protein
MGDAVVSTSTAVLSATAVVWPLFSSAPLPDMAWWSLWDLSGPSVATNPPGWFTAWVCTWWQFLTTQLGIGTQINCVGVATVLKLTGLTFFEYLFYTLGIVICVLLLQQLLRITHLQYALLERAAAAAVLLFVLVLVLVLALFLLVVVVAAAAMNRCSRVWFFSSVVFRYNYLVMVLIVSSFPKLCFVPLLIWPDYTHHQAFTAIISIFVLSSQITALKGAHARMLMEVPGAQR